MPKEKNHSRLKLSPFDPFPIYERQDIKVNNCGKRTYVGQSLEKCWTDYAIKYYQKHDKFPSQLECEGHVWGTNYAASTRYQTYRRVINLLESDLAWFNNPANDGPLRRWL